MGSSSYSRQPATSHPPPPLCLLRTLQGWMSRAMRCATGSCSITPLAALWLGQPTLVRQLTCPRPSRYFVQLVNVAIGVAPKQ